MPLPLLAIGAISSAISSLPSWYQAWKQDQQANELAKNLHRPDFEIPESEKAALENAKAVASMTRLPGQSGIEGKLERTAADEVANVERMGTGGANDINAASRIYSGLQTKENELGISAANMFLGNQGVLRNQLNTDAEWQNKKWAWDKQMPYINTANSIAALRGASTQNFNNAWQDVFGGGANLALGEYLKGGGVGNPGEVGKSITPAETPSTTIPLTQMADGAYGYQPEITSKYPLVQDQEFNFNTRPIMSSFDFNPSFR